MLKIAETKDKLPPDTNVECPICYENINLDEVKEGVPNCLICGNGHRMHRHCPSFPFDNPINQCPVCKTSNMKNCKSQAGYAYAERKGGKKRRRKTYKRKKTYKRRKTSKRRK
jgi:hypothetical protein